MDSNSVVLIVGGTGSIGSILTRKLLDHGVGEIRVLARDETRHQQLIDLLGRPSNLTSIIGDIRDKSSLEEAVEGADIVINAAAMKHVKYCEDYPIEAYKTNVLGTQNLIELCLQKNIHKFVLASTDKAADPSTAYGASKFMAERLMVSAAMRNPGYQFVAVRFGNVLGSRNSVLPRLRQLLDLGMPLTVVKDTMTRYVMTQDDAAELVVDALRLGEGGEIFTRDMPVVQIQDLIRVFVDRYAREKNVNTDKFPVVEHEVRHGEKAHEALFSDHEKSRVLKNRRTLVFAPSGVRNVTGEPLAGDFALSSERAPKLSSSEISSLLDRAKI